MNSITFQGVNLLTGESIGPKIAESTQADVTAMIKRAEDAKLHLAQSSPSERSALLRSIATAIDAAMESFFALLQKNVLNRKRWATREELRLAIAIWIETTYNRRRRQRALGSLAPREFETIHQESQVAGKQ